MKLLIGIFTLLGFVACTNAKPEQNLEQLDKKSAREVTLKTVTQGDSVLHITVQTIWFNGEQVVAQADTLKTAISPNTWDVVDSTKNLSKVPIYVTVQ